MGPLPTLYRWRVAIMTPLLCIALGFVVGRSPDVPVVPLVGAALGLALGVVLAAAMVHDFSGRARRARVRPR